MKDGDVKGIKVKQAEEYKESQVKIMLSTFYEIIC